MISDTNARASRFARWFGSLDRKGLSGRRAPPSPIAGAAPGGVAGGRGDVGRLLAGADGTNGGADGTAADCVGGVNGDIGAGAAGGGVNGGTGGGGVNSGRLLAGEGGVAVAVTGPRSIGCSRPVRGAGPTSLARAGGGAAAGRCVGAAGGFWRADP